MDQFQNYQAQGFGSMQKVSQNFKMSSMVTKTLIGVVLQVAIMVICLKFNLSIYSFESNFAMVFSLLLIVGLAFFEGWCLQRLQTTQTNYLGLWLGAIGSSGIILAQSTIAIIYFFLGQNIELAQSIDSIIIFAAIAGAALTAGTVLVLPFLVNHKRVVYGGAFVLSLIAGGISLLLIVGLIISFISSLFGNFTLITAMNDILLTGVSGMIISIFYIVYILFIISIQFINLRERYVAGTLQTNDEWFYSAYVAVLVSELIYWIIRLLLQILSNNNNQ